MRYVDKKMTDDTPEETTGTTTTQSSIANDVKKSSDDDLVSGLEDNDDDVDVDVDDDDDEDEDEDEDEENEAEEKELMNSKLNAYRLQVNDLDRQLLKAQSEASINAELESRARKRQLARFR